MDIKNLPEFTEGGGRQWYCSLFGTPARYRGVIVRELGPLLGFWPLSIWMRMFVQRCRVPVFTVQGTGERWIDGKY